jgi:hypothetical protein
MIYGIAMMKMNKRTASKPNTIEKSQIIKLWVAAHIVIVIYNVLIIKSQKRFINL